MVIKYKLKITPKDIPDNVLLLRYGSLSKEKNKQVYSNKLEYIHNECVGAFIRENNDSEILLYTIKDFGDKFCCRFIIKDSADIFYLSGYNAQKVIDEIIISENIKDEYLIAEKILKGNK